MPPPVSTASLLNPKPRHQTNNTNAGADFGSTRIQPLETLSRTRGYER